jgi:LysM repeat protein
MPTYKTKKGDNIKTIKPISRTGQKLLGMKNVRKGSTAKKAGGSMKKKGYAMGGAMKKKGMAKGGKLKMVEKDGKKVPFFAADGKGKMAKGGMMNKKGYAMGGAMKKKGMKKGGMMKKGYAKGGSVKVKSGDTLSQIAKSKGVTLKALLKANPGIKNANMIKVGQNIKVPTGQGKSIGPAGRSSNPYKGLTKNQMAALGQKKDNAFGSAKQRQRAATSSIRNTDAEGRVSGSPKPNKIMTTKSAKPTVKRGDRRNAAAKKAAPTMPTPKPSKPKDSRRTGRKAMGGMMKKKGMSKGGAMKRSKGGTVRGAGAATRGKRFGRSA